MTKSLNQHIQHFVNSNQQTIISAGQSLSSGSLAAFESLVSRVSNLEVTKSISNMVNSSSTAFSDFMTNFEERFDGRAIKFVFGGVLSGIGGVAIAEAAGLAVALGISVLSVQVIALALIILGLNMMLPNIWEIAKERILSNGEYFSLED